MINPERYIGKIILFRNGEHLPTNLFMQYRNGRLSFVAETEIPPRKSEPIQDRPHQNKKIISSADRLVELVHTHHKNMELSVRS
jgi:hypothetical protein